MTSVEIAWLAGLLEGEGSFSKAKGSVTVQLGMTDEDTVRRAAKLVGDPFVGSHQIHRWGKNQKINYRWTLCGDKAAAWMMTIYPLMSSRRQARIRELLSVWKATRPYRKLVTACPHTDRPHQGRGMCASCCQRAWYQRRKGGDALEWQ